MASDARWGLKPTYTRVYLPSTAVGMASDARWGLKHFESDYIQVS
jgi:hypothetical protein